MVKVAVNLEKFTTNYRVVSFYGTLHYIFFENEGRDRDDRRSKNEMDVQFEIYMNVLYV